MSTAAVERDSLIAHEDDLLLVTGASGFIGSRLVACLLDRGFRNVRCFARPNSEMTALGRLRGSESVHVVTGNLLSRNDCDVAMKGVKVIFHLATARDGKSYSDAFMNSVVTTRNLLDASLEHQCLRRFVNVSSLAVYTNKANPRGRLLDEHCPVERRPQSRGDAYCFAKVKQDELVIEYGGKFGIPYVIVRPGYVLGPDKAGISSRVGIDTFGVFLHLGGSNTIPFTYVDNCADAIALAGLTKGTDGEVFNVVDDDLPSSRSFLCMYKRNARKFKSVYLPHALSYGLCYLWEKYSEWSDGQLPATFNRPHWHAYWKKTRYSNEKLKTRVGWQPKVSMREALARCFRSYRENETHA